MPWYAKTGVFFFLSSHTSGGGPWCNDPSSLRSSPFKTSLPPLSFPFSPLTSQTSIKSAKNAFHRFVSCPLSLLWAVVYTVRASTLSSCRPHFQYPSSRCYLWDHVHVQCTNIVDSDICKIIFAIILPPLGVFLERGCGADFLINILLTILGWIPGVIHAMYVFIWWVCSLPWQMLTISQLHYLQILEIPTSHTSSQPTLSKTNIPWEVYPLGSEDCDQFHINPYSCLALWVRVSAIRYPERRCQRDLIPWRSGWD